MDQPAGSPNPSMQEILASIKRIIADPMPPPPRSADPVPPPAAGDEDDVLHLGEPPVADAPIAEPAIAPAPTVTTHDDAPLLSGAARAASAQAMASLSGIAIDPHAAANTLDGLVRELLRPMLKDWLDANLPDLVERVVAREVARLGGR